MGCRGLTGDLDLSKNDLDDSFVEEFLRIVEKSDGILDSVNLDENRITTDGALELVGGIQARARQSFGCQPLLLQLMNNAVDNCKEVEAVADAAGLRCRVGPPWTMEEAARAVKRKETWWLYFYGPIQLLRSKMLDIPSQPTMVECPICNCILKQDLGSVSDPEYTVTDNLTTHFCGDKHRKKIKGCLKDPESMCNILIVSPLWSFTLHPLTGELKWVKEREDLHVMQPDRDNYHVDVGGEATSVRAVLWPEGRESMAKQVSPEMAYDILEHRHELENSHVDGHDGLNPTDSADGKLNVRDIEFTQAGISRCFQDGRPLETMISDLDRGRLDPCSLKLEVVEWRGRFYSNDNRRLYCLKEHQRHVNWDVKVMAKVYTLKPALERLIVRLAERWNLIGDTDPDYIRVRGPRVQSTPPWCC